MELTPQQWENVKALFEVALEKTPTERTAFLAEAVQDSAVRREVERLLAHHVESGGFLSDAAVPGRASPSPPAPSQSFLPNDLVAERFRITRFLARGGMGEVYEAEDLELHERVALKSIRSELLHDGRALDREKDAGGRARGVAGDRRPGAHQHGTLQSWRSPSLSGRFEGRSQDVRAGRKPVEANRRPERSCVRTLQPGRCIDGGGKFERRSRLLHRIDHAANPNRGERKYRGISDGAGPPPV